MYANDVWYLRNKYNGDMDQKRSEDGNLTYFISGQEVTKKEYQEYFDEWQLHEKRAGAASLYIQRRHNLMVWLIRHYKLGDGENPIPKLQESAYKHTEARAKKEAA